MLATDNGYTDAVKALLQAGAGLNDAFKTAADLAREHGYAELAELLEQAPKEQAKQSVQAAAKPVEMTVNATKFLVTDKGGKAALTNPSETGSQEAIFFVKNGYPQNKVFSFVFNPRTRE